MRVAGVGEAFCVSYDWLGTFVAHCGKCPGQKARLGVGAIVSGLDIPLHAAAPG